MALGLCTWIAKYIGIIPGEVTQLVIRLIPKETTAWTISLVVCPLGFVCLYLSYFIPAQRFKKRLKKGQLTIGDMAVIEEIGKSKAEQERCT